MSISNVAVRWVTWNNQTLRMLLRLPASKKKFSTVWKWFKKTETTYARVMIWISESRLNSVVYFDKSGSSTCFCHVRWYVNTYLRSFQLTVQRLRTSTLVSLLMLLLDVMEIPLNLILHQWSSLWVCDRVSV